MWVGAPNCEGRLLSLTVVGKVSRNSLKRCCHLLPDEGSGLGPGFLLLPLGSTFHPLSAQLSDAVKVRLCPSSAHISPKAPTSLMLEA